MPYTVCPNCGQRALRVATRCPRCGVAFESQFIRHAPPPARRIPVGLILAGAVLTILAGNALWQKFGVAPGATAIVRRPAPAPAPAPTIAARPEPVRQPAVTPAETPASPRPATPRAAEPRVAAPAPMVPRPAPGLAVTPPVTAPAAPVRAPASSVTVAARATASPENAAARAKRLYSSTWLNLRAERRNSSPVLRILHPGEPVRVDSLSQGWYRVVSDGNQPGWVDRRLLDSLPPPAQPGARE